MMSAAPSVGELNRLRANRPDLYRRLLLPSDHDQHLTALDALIEAGVRHPSGFAYPLRYIRGDHSCGDPKPHWNDRCQPPSLSQLAEDEQAVTLLHEARAGMTADEYCRFTNYLAGVLAVTVNAEQMEWAIKIAGRAIARVDARIAGATEGDAPEEDGAVLDHDRLTDAAQDGWGR